MSRNFPDDSAQHKAWMETRRTLKSRLRTMAETGWNPIGQEALDRIEDLEIMLWRVYGSADIDIPPAFESEIREVLDNG